ncbi:Protein-tyrosine-phosphatase [Ascochyta rabiei]|uniref:Protein-tyrosine-phosphatase n=1 Tax=Didymella rabiei TaxID=5454 RepID=UPI002207D144|nr:Protein-tyrosine-phosphatase [Ascochyta rabiei]UPX12782.1 Protein-tyrosine-phosphatase [Ascochyta rabiei]
MPTTTSRTYTSVPSFGAVFGAEPPRNLTHNLPPAQTTDHDPSTVHGNNVAQRTSSGNTTHGAPFSSFHNHHDSRDSNSTASSDNSPTTTISTMDSSSVTDPSPGPSPESPVPKSTNHSFAADFRARRPETADGTSSTTNFFELQRPATPAKKARNLKNLGINTTTSLTNLRAQAPAALAAPDNKEKNSSAPPSPLFIKPPTPPRRRPSNLSLTIATPGINDNKPTRLVIPSTPSLGRPALRHFQSSPSLPLCSPSVAPAGGMKLPALRPIVTKSSGLSEVPFEMEEEEEEPNFDIPQSKEEKPAAYPNGPICIYPAGVYLYFEPTAEQAATFDVIVNVASEVQNPFTSSNSESQKDLNARRVDGPAAENVDFAALSQQPKSTFGFGNDSPTTPKATPPVLQTIQPGETVLNGKTYRTPEYIHMPWEHNTDIVPDLYKLVKVMDDRVKRGKRVLVHCQCGVSRSASLVVAYGLYKEPEVSVQEAYDKAKKRSKWIGPNMNLIMQLQEFRNGLLRQNQNSRSQNQGFGRRVGFPSTAATNNRFSCPNPERDDVSGSRVPQTAPLPPDTDMSMQRASTGNMMAISPGPLSAPSGAFGARFRNSWDSSQSNFDLSPTSTPNTIPYVDPKGHVVPVVEVTVNGPPLTPMEVPAIPEIVHPEPEPTLQAPNVPNFSRQLSLRSYSDAPVERSIETKSTHLAPMKPMGFAPLKSPVALTFNIPSYSTQQDRDDDYEIKSPVKTSFDLPWPSEYDEPEPSLLAPKAQDSFYLGAPPKSPMFPPPRLTLPKSRSDRSEKPCGFLPFRPAQEADQSAQSETFARTENPPALEQASKLASPTFGSFPEVAFSPSRVLDTGSKSPRAAEFHMAPLRPTTADEDPFGLTSPTRRDFSSGNPFDNLASSQHFGCDDRRPAFQAILPPSHQTFNGFASLDGHARTPSNQTLEQPLAPIQAPPPKRKLNIDSRVDSLSAFPETNVIAATPTQASNQVMPPERPQTPRTKEFLATPAKAIRTRFSAPNMKEQRQLSKLQSEMESKLANRPEAPQQAMDDLDALMSPRAEEFTRNPFHLDLRPSAEEVSPASSDETIKDEKNSHTWSKAPRPWTPEKLTVDPRSPAQTGSSPIVRNIWDVL